MLLVMLQDCPGCELYHEKNPHLPSVIIPLIQADDTADLIPIRTALTQLGINKFPVVLNDSLTMTIPLSVVDPSCKADW
jgi:hypothetical protein